jgi:hypothetical protein
MRILIGVILVLVAGGVIAASILIQPPTLTASEQTQVKSNCSECHKVPVIKSAASVHSAHPTVNCAVCHTGGTTARVDFNSCVSCHSVPAYSNAASVHDAHSTTACITCHSDAAGLVTADRAQNVLRWVGIGLAGLVVAGLVLNFIIAKLRLGRR